MRNGGNAYLISEHSSFKAVFFLLLFQSYCTLHTGKFREEFKAAFVCHCSGQGEKKERVRTKVSTDSHKSLSTQVSHFDNVSRISDQVM